MFQALIGLASGYVRAVISFPLFLGGCGDGEELGWSCALARALLRVGWREGVGMLFDNTGGKALGCYLQCSKHVGGFMVIRQIEECRQYYPFLRCRFFFHMSMTPSFWILRSCRRGAVHLYYNIKLVTSQIAVMQPQDLMISMCSPQAGSVCVCLSHRGYGLL